MALPITVVPAPAPAVDGAVRGDGHAVVRPAHDARKLHVVHDRLERRIRRARVKQHELASACRSTTTLDKHPPGVSRRANRERAKSAIAGAHC